MTKSVLLVSALSLGLLACAGTTDTSQWPTPANVQTALVGIDAAYHTDCGFQPNATWCSKTAQAQAKVCKIAADAGLVAYADAYHSGDFRQAVLDNEATLIPTLTACIAKIKNGG